MLFFIFFFFFFFSSRRRHTRSLCDWSSDVCSSDLHGVGRTLPLESLATPIAEGSSRRREHDAPHVLAASPRSEERRVGKECRSRWSPYHEKKKMSDNNKTIRVKQYN